MTDAIEWELVHDPVILWVGQVLQKDHTSKQLYLDMQRADLDLIYDAVCRSCAPLPHNEIVQRIVKLKVLTRSASATTEDQALQIAAIAEKVREYPADAAAYAFTTWPEHNVWFPSWAEFKKLMLSQVWRRLRTKDLIEAYKEKNK